MTIEIGHSVGDLASSSQKRTTSDCVICVGTAPESHHFLWGDLNESYQVLTPNADPSVAEDCQTTFQNDTYGFRSWASWANRSQTEGPESYIGGFWPQIGDIWLHYRWFFPETLHGAKHVARANGMWHLLGTMQSCWERQLVVEPDVTNLGPDATNITSEWSTWSKRQVLEVGSNVGCWSLYAAKVMKMEVLAVEPNKFAAFFLQYNIALNQLQNQVTVLHGALVPALPTVPQSERSANHQFCNPGLGDLQAGEVYDPLDPCNEKEEVVGYTLEALLLRLHNVSILRMNCEGCEVETLPDVDPSLLKRISRISLEIFEEKPRDSKFLKHPKTPHLLELMCTDLIWPADRRVAALAVCSATEVVAILSKHSETFWYLRKGKRAVAPTPIPIQTLWRYLDMGESKSAIF